MLYRFRQRLNRKWFNFWCRGILATPPIKVSADGIMIVSMVSHLDVLMYLIAIKSFYSYVNQGKIVIINDGTLTSDDIKLLNSHILSPEIVDAKDITSDKCPKGGTWERLIFVANHIKDYYIIQMDSDSLVIRNINEVWKCIRDNRSFAISSYANSKVESMEKTWKNMQSIDSDYIEIVVQKRFNELDNFKNLKYAKCSSCFVGYAKGSFSLTDIEEFSVKMQKIVGKRWWEWGTEKITSNFIIANTDNTCILPYPKYVSYYANPNIAYEESVFLHFTGTHRFKNGFYIKMARRVIRRLQKSCG